MTFLATDGPNGMSSYTSKNSRLEQPRAVVILAGVAYVPISCEVTQSAHGTLSTASVTLPISSNPDFSTLLSTQKNDGSVVAQIYMGFPASISADLKDYKQLQRVFWGVVDTVEPRFGLANEVTITMRSLGALLELTRHTNLSLNETTVAFVKAAAQSVGLKFNIVLKSGQIPGTLSAVYGKDIMVGMHNEKVAQTLIECAEYDDVDTWVDGDVLNYCDPGSISRNITTLHWGHDLIDFSGKHSPQFNKNVRVEVRTYNPKLRFSHTTRYTYGADGSLTMSESDRSTLSTQSFGSTNTTQSSSTSNLTKGSQSSSTSSSSSSGGVFNSGATSIPSDSSAEVYVIRRPNLTREQANRLALVTALQISRNEFQATMNISPSAAQFKEISITSWFQVVGLPYARWNTSPQYPYFWPRRITTKFDMSGGLSMEIEAINHRLPTAQI